MFLENLTDINQLISSPWFMMAMAWSIFWKGLALWFASQRKQKIWFAVLLIANTFGILDIIYLLFVAKAIVEIRVVKDKKKDW